MPKPTDDHGRSSTKTADEHPEHGRREPEHDELHHAATEIAPIGARLSSEPTKAVLPELPTVPREHYEIFGELARGGLGRILRARDVRLDRTVAIKELHLVVGNAEARFAREMRLTARLQHPSIVPIHEAGRWPTGEPFYAMKLVAGRSLADIAEEERPLGERLRSLPSVLDVAEAIAYAHSERIIHRDLKPANVLVGPFGETVVIDWGLAKDLDEDEVPSTPHVDQPDAHADDALDTFHTSDGAVLGTPAYMPPEQARGSAVDERADVYALGAILYHVLSGHRPYQGTPRPLLVERVANEPPIPLTDLEPDLPPDLVAIVDKAMSRRMDDRYATANELAEDLRRFTTGNLVGSYEYSPAELFRRFVLRQRAAVGTALLALMVLAALGVYAFASITRERDAAESAARSEAEARVKEEAARHEAEARLDELHLEKARVMLESDPTGALAWLKRLAEPRRGAVTVALEARDRGVAFRVLRGHTDRVWEAAFSPDGRKVASASSDESVRVWDVATGESERLDGHTDRVSAVAFSPDGATLASASYDEKIFLWNLSTGTHTTLEGHRGAVKGVAWSRDGETLASVGADSTVRVWSVADRSLLHAIDAHVDRDAMVQFDPDGTLLISASHDGRIAIVSVATGEHRFLEGHQGDVTWFDVSRDGTQIVSAGGDGTVRLWNVASGEGRVLGRHDSEASVAIFGPNGDIVASAGLDGVVVIWDLTTGTRRDLLGHDERIGHLSFSPDGRSIASAGWDRTARIWNLDSGEVSVLRGHADVVSSVEISPDGTTLVTASWDRELRLFRLLRPEGRVFRGHTIGVHSVDFSPDGASVASGGHDDTVRLFDVATGEGRVLGRHADHVFRVRFSPNGQYVASSSDDRTVRLFSTRTAERRVFGGHRADVEEIAWSTDGSRLASGAEDDTVRLWTIPSGASRALEGHTEPITAIAFSPDGSLLASGSRDRTVRLWNVASGEARVLSGHALEVWGVAFSPDGHFLVSAGLDDRVLVWDVTNPLSEPRPIALTGPRFVAFSPDGHTLAVASTSRHVWICQFEEGECEPLEGHDATIHSIAFSPAGDALAAASGDGTVRLWDVHTGESRVYRGHRAPVFDLAFSHDGRFLVSGSADADVRLWQVALPPPPSELRAFLDELTAETFR